MATINPFDLLGDDTEDPSLLAAQQPRIEPKKIVAPPTKQPAQNKAAAQPKLPSKPAPPVQADVKSESRRGGRGGGRGYGRGGTSAGFNRDFANNENSYGYKEVSAAKGASDEVDGRSIERRGGYGGPRGPFRGGGRRGGFSNGEAGEGERDYPRRPYERRSGTGRGNELKREGAGRGNWGSQTEELAQVTEEVVNEDEKNLNVEKPEADVPTDAEKEVIKDENDEKEPEDKEMTLEEYEKLLEEKRKALVALKTEERKVDAKEFETMQPLSNKKSNDDIFIKLGSEKDKKKELAEKEERAKKSLSINEFLKPAEGEKYYNTGSRGRGRGPRGGGYAGGSDRNNAQAPAIGGSDRNNAQAPAIEDPGQFPTLGGK